MGQTSSDQHPAASVADHARGSGARFARAFSVLFAAMMLLLSLLVTTTFWPSVNAMLHGRLTYGYRAVPNPHPGLTHSGLLQWTGETRTTPATATVPAPSAGLLVDPAFATYYQRHGGAARLGAPLTPSFESSGGLIQFFTNGALVRMPAAPPGARGGATGDASAWGGLISAGIHDPQDGVVELPLLHSLLTAGSLAPVVNSSLTYADLRAATDPSRRVVESADASSQDWVFVPEATDGKLSSGHRVPVALWRYINDSGVSPDGWQTDVGAPLTEALPITVPVGNGTVHHELVQAFWQTAFVLDEDALDSSGDPTIQRLPVGHDYLATLGYPAAVVVAGQPEWADTAATIAQTPNGAVEAHVGTYWPVALSGSSLWINGMLWYSVAWEAGNRTGLAGWMPASALTSSPPPSGVAGRGVAFMDALSPSLVSYLAQFSGNVGMAVYDVTRNQYYEFDGSNTYVMGSSAKVPIMVTYLNWVEHQGRGLSDDENWLLTTMIENSNNDSAQTLYDDLGGDAAINGYLSGIGVGAYLPNPDGWGWGLFSPRQMVTLLYKLSSGQILNGHDRSYALSLMENIEADQRFGVGQTAPSGATVAMKDGWLPALDGLWAANSSGIVTVGGETYIISVYTAEQNDLSANYAILNHVCGVVATALVS